MTRTEQDALRADMVALLAAVDAGDVEMTTPMRYRLEGAVAVLAVVAGDDERAVLDALSSSP